MKDEFKAEFDVVRERFPKKMIPRRYGTNVPGMRPETYWKTPREIYDETCQVYANSIKHRRVDANFIEQAANAEWKRYTQWNDERDRPIVVEKKLTALDEMFRSSTFGNPDKDLQYDQQSGTWM